MTPESAITLIDESDPSVSREVIGTGAHERVSKYTYTHNSGTGIYERTPVYDLSNQDVAMMTDPGSKVVIENPVV